jgi:kumamolisin
LSPTGTPVSAALGSPLNVPKEMLYVMNQFVPLPGSERTAVAQARPARPLDGSARIEATLVLRRRTEVPQALIEGPATLSRAEFAERHGADPADMDLVRRMLSGHGITVTEADAASRRLKVSGSVNDLAAVFGATLSLVSSPSPTGGAPVEHRHREGGLHVPAELDGIVLAVLGLDDRPQAAPHLRHARTDQAAHGQTSYTPLQLGTVYQFPAGTDGSGQTLAVIELGGGFAMSDLDPYFSSLGLSTPSVTAVGVDGGSNVAGRDPQGADGEVLLDIEVAGALAPGARQLVYFAPNTDRGFVDAVSTAVHADPTPTAVSISWGGPEDNWTAQARAVFDQALADAGALGVTVCVAAGDNGSSDGMPDARPHTDFPASSPHALACGGTRLDADPAKGTVSAERVWNDGNGGGATGGGVSVAFALPAWQATVGVPHNGGRPGRGVPDVAADADPATGYEIMVDGQRMIIGGTSAVAPLWAALTCRLSQALGRPLGMLQPALYAGADTGHTTPGFHDITDGNNGHYTAAAGWDACTGLGTPNGTALLNRLKTPATH